MEKNRVVTEPPIRQAVLEKGLDDNAYVEEVCRRLPPTCAVAEARSKNETGRGGPYDLEKDVVHLMDYKGEFLKPCPGTREYICCGYQILNIGTNCPLDCSYCILQSYVNQPRLRVFTNIREALPHVFEFIDMHPNRIFRIGTGEFTDSLALDPLMKWSDFLLSSFSKRKNVILELKTKTGAVNGLLASPYRERIVVSWSLNSAHIAAREEKGGISIQKRIQTAQRLQREGFVVGFHFDPLICHPGWKAEYLKTIDLMVRYLDPKRIIWTSLGSFRFMPQLKRIIRKRHPKTEILNGEFIRGLDGKMRYFRPIRTELYRFISENLKEWYPQLGLYLCMESDDVWRESMGWSPRVSSGLSDYLDSRVRDVFG
ncbi:MAG: DNA photolyase [Deltaproteobacteria bacterium]|jgi:spore photoproduct lyase